MDLLTQIIVAVLTSSAVAGAVVVAGGFLVKSIIDRWITMSLKRYETSLQMSLESYKTSLQQSASEHQTRFTKLHEKRAEVIDELYKRMARVQRNFDELIKPFVLPGEKTPDESTCREWQPISRVYD